jgi:tetratricopeptide (TPR) repeat protein
VALQTDACEATRVRRTATSEVLAQRAACLDDHRTEMGELAAAFAAVTTRDGVDQADAAAQRLSTFDDCAASDADALTRDAATRAVVTEVARLTASANARLFVGEYDRAQALAAQALDRARTIDDPPTLLRALFVLGQAQERRQAWPEAVAAYREGARVAFAMGDHAATAGMYAALMTVLVNGLDDVAGATALRSQAEAELAAAGDEPLTELGVEEAIGTVLHRSGDLDGALAVAEHSLVLIRTRLPAQTSHLVEGLLNVGRMQFERRRFAEASKAAAEALQLAEAAFGPAHPTTAEALQLAAQAAKEQGDLDSAQALAERALTARTARFGAEDTRTLATLLTIANIAKQRGDLDRARTLYEQRLEILSRSPSATRRQVAMALWTVAQIHVVQGDHAGAAPYFERAFAATEEAAGRDSLDYMKVENDLAESLRAQGRSREALPHYEHMLAVVRAKLPAMVPDFLAAIAECRREAATP